MNALGEQHKDAKPALGIFFVLSTKHQRKALRQPHCQSLIPVFAFDTAQASFIFKSIQK